MRPIKRLRPSTAKRMAVPLGHTRENALAACQHHRVQQRVRHPGSQRSRIEALYGWRPWACSTDALMRLLRG